MHTFPLAGASPGFKNQELAVVGGGDTALEEALYLTKYGKHVHLLVRSERMRASKTMQVRDRLLFDRMWEPSQVAPTKLAFSSHY